MEGRPINELINVVILLLLKIRKIRDIRFVENLTGPDPDMNSLQDVSFILMMYDISYNL